MNDPDPPEAWYLVGIDPVSNEVERRVPLFEASDVTVGAGSVWVTGRERGIGAVVWRVDPDTGVISQTIQLGCSDCAAGEIVATSDVVWAEATNTTAPGGWLFRIDPETSSVEERLMLERDVRDLSVGPDALWMYALTHFRGGAVAGGTLYRLTPSAVTPFLTGEVPPRAGGTMPPVLAADDRYVWTSRLVGQGPREQAVRIDQTTNEVEVVGIEGPFLPFGVGEGGIWFRGGTEDAEPVISRLNTETLEVDASLPLESAAIDAALDPETGTIWVADYERWVTRIDVR